MTRRTALLSCLLTICAGAVSGGAWAADEAPPALLEQRSPTPIGHASGSGGCDCNHHTCATAAGPLGLGVRGAGGRLGGFMGAHANCLDARSGCVVGLSRHAHGAVCSGQPFIDPWARADWIAANQAATRSWHAGYYNTQYGAPVALVVPPTARMQTRMGWGVSQSTMSPIYPQFERPYPGPVMVDAATGLGPAPLQPTPRWPSHTDQFGVYYVRGPW
jgi:hypothetical protein